MTAMTEQEAIDMLVAQLSANSERIRTLEADNARLTRDLVAAQIQRDTAQAQVCHNTLRGW
jgi:hypothetical protein